MVNKERNNTLKLGKEDLVIMIFQEGPCRKEDHLFPGMDLILTVFVVVTFVIRLWIAYSMEEEVFQVPTSHSYFGDETMSVTLLHVIV